MVEMPSQPLGAATSGPALQPQAVSGPTPGCSPMKRLKGMHALAWGVQMPPPLLLAKPKLLVLLIAAAADADNAVAAHICAMYRHPLGAYSVTDGACTSVVLVQLSSLHPPQLACLQ